MTWKHRASNQLLETSIDFRQMTFWDGFLLETSPSAETLTSADPAFAQDLDMLVYHYGLWSIDVYAIDK